MWLTIRRSLLAHKLRLALTALAVVLGVAFVSGTFVLTDTMRGTFDDLMATAYGDVDVAVQGREEFSASLGSAGRGPVPAELVERVAAVDGVAAVEAEVQGVAQLLDASGVPLGNAAAPRLGGQAPTVEEMYAVELRDGVYPDQPGEIAIDAGTATEHGFAVGDTVDVVPGAGAVTSQTIVGIVGYGDLDSLAGASLTLFDPDTAFELYNVDGGYSVLNVLAEDGVERADLRDRIAPLVGDDLEVLTGEEMVDAQAAAVSEGLGFLSTALLVFAGISLFVGAFIIFNTFSIIVAQRTRELALLRAVGASRRQVVTSVLTEAVATGLVGSVIGVVLGLGVASGLRLLLDAFGLSLPSGSLVFATRTVVVSLAIGIGVTMVAALGPALRSLQVPPVAAMQAVAAPPAPKKGRARTIVGGLLTVAGVGVLAAGLGGGGVPVVGAGAVLTILGFALLAALVTRPVVRLLGWPLDRALGIRGELATQNALRNPKRTASTASALMIGLGLVSFVMIFGASITASASAAMEESFVAEFSIRPSGNSPDGGFSQDVVDAVASLDEVEVAMPMILGDVRYGDTVQMVAGVEPSLVEQTIAMDAVDGSLADLTDGFAVKRSVAESEDWQVGDVVPLEFAATGVQQLELQAIVDGDVDVSWYFANDTLRANGRDPQVFQAFVKLADGSDVDEARPAIEDAIAGYPSAQLMDQSQLLQQVQDGVSQILGLLTALLVLSVVIALFGLVNTLGLSVFERIRELGLLRAVGASQRQVRAMVRWEAVLIATLGATLGLGIGSLFGWMLVRALADEGISRFTLPSGQLTAAFVLAALAGVLAAAMPARKAGRVDVLRALEMQ